jgi:predicted nuclease of predicted toxin-antitoxin system
MGLSEADDPTVLEWAAQHNRVVLTHDIATMTNFAYE